jgi:protein phosphatase
MKIYQFSNLGKRTNNEDSLGNNKALFTVCDGMGGHNYGERASAFVVDWMLDAFSQIMPLDKSEIQQQLSNVQLALNGVLEKEPELEKMGTTFTGIFRTPDVWYAAHIGDSRIYLFRPSERKLWHTWDHSMVGELMRTHEITVEAGRFHPMSNRISKAIIAQRDGKPVMASVAKFDELKDGDVLLLCSDGVVEAWGDWDLVQLLENDSLSFEEKCNKIAAQCNERSKDNNTAIIAEIEAPDAFSYGHNDEIQWTTFDEVKTDYMQYVHESGAATSEDAASDKGYEAPKQDSLRPRGNLGSANNGLGSKPQKKRSFSIFWLAFMIFVLSMSVVFFLRSSRGDDANDDGAKSNVSKIDTMADDVSRQNNNAQSQNAKSLNGKKEQKQKKNDDKIEKPNSPQNAEMDKTEQTVTVKNDTTPGEKIKPNAGDMSKQSETQSQSKGSGTEASHKDVQDDRSSQVEENKDKH